MVLPFVRHASDPLDDPDGFRFSKLNWWPERLRRRIG